MRLCKFHALNPYAFAVGVIKQENRRATKRGLGADLTLRQFANALDHFSQSGDYGRIHTCVYCSRHTQLGIDHWLPLSMGGGTTVTNVVPCCSDCNSMKSALTGDEFFQNLIEVFKSPVAEVNYQQAKLYFVNLNS